MTLSKHHTPTLQRTLFWSVGFLVLLLFVTSCNSNNTKQITVNKDVLTISGKNYRSKSWHYEPQTQLLFFSDGNKIVQYSLSTKEISKVVSFAFEIGSFVHTSDDLWVVTEAKSGAIYVVTKTGELRSLVDNLNWYDYNEWHSRLTNVNDKLVFCQFPVNTDHTLIPSHKTEYIVSLKDSSYMINYNVFPQETYRNDYHIIGIEYSRTHKGETMYFSFPFTHYIYVFKEGQKIDSIDATSKVFDNYEFPTFKLNGLDEIQAKINYVATCGSYSRIYYVEKADVLIRMVIHPRPLKGKDGYNIMKPRQNTLQVIDLKTKKVQEFKLNGDYYSSMIPYENGMLIQQHSEDNENTTFDYIDFSNFM